MYKIIQQLDSVLDGMSTRYTWVSYHKTFHPPEVYLDLYFLHHILSIDIVQYQKFNYNFNWK